MKDSSTYYIDLISRYFSGESTPGEIDELLAWIQENEENRKTFSDYKKAWELTETRVIQEKTDLDEEWAALKMMMTQQNNAEPRVIALQDPKTASASVHYPWLKIAAAIVLLLTSTTIAYYFYTSTKKIVISADAGILHETLPDGSVITLNKGAQLEYAPGFMKKRHVTLKGEAYFEVTHDPSHPFIVEGNHARVEVLGTRFNVNTQGLKGHMSVVLTEGKVSLYFSNSRADKVILQPGEQAEISPSDHMIIKTGKPDSNYMAWKTRRILFDDVPLSEIISTLASVYHVNIKLADPGLENCRITATFDNQPVTSVLNVIRSTLDLQIQNQGNIYMLSGKPCN